MTAEVRSPSLRAIGAVDSDTERDKRSLVNVARYPVQVRADGMAWSLWSGHKPRLGGARLLEAVQEQAV